MSTLEKLKAATSLSDVADLLGFKPKALSYLLYIKDINSKYTSFQVPKKSGGARTIHAPYPDLKNLQKRLSDVLQDCIAEIKEIRKVKNTLSHGFTRDGSILTNASVHRGRRFVFNLDLESFFETINFGRVRGFFITDKNFGLNPKVATVLAQIVCHNHVLPQGSPCSPVVSNLIGHLLDIKLVKVAAKYGCSYSRYADDLTFSTNKQSFPAEICCPDILDEHTYRVGPELASVVTRAGFRVNPSKTRLQYQNSRQQVTGVVVNKHLNCRSEYRAEARLMVHRYVTTGKYSPPTGKIALPANPAAAVTVGSASRLNGILSFIDSVDQHGKSPDRPESRSGRQKVYHKFLFYNKFFANSKPLVICEGKTDNIYLRSAITKLVDYYPSLAVSNEPGKISFGIDLFRYTSTTDRVMHLAGGYGDLVGFLRELRTNLKLLGPRPQAHPVIILVDNDDGGRKVINCGAGLKKVAADYEMRFLHVIDNIYIVATPLLAAKTSDIEAFFETSVKEMKLQGKSFHAGTTGFDWTKHFGKQYFAEHVVKRHIDTINFDGFKPLLDRLVAVIEDYALRRVSAH